MRWAAALDQLDPATQARLMVALGAGARAARLATEVVEADGEVSETLRYLSDAIEHPTAVQRRLTAVFEFVSEMREA